MPTEAEIRFDATRLGVGDRIVGGASVALMIGIFLPWFEFGSVGTGYFSFSATALRTWMYLTLVISLAIVGLLVAKTLCRTLRLLLPPWLILLGACGGNLAITLACFTTKAVGISWDYGAYFSLAAAVVAVGGAVVSGIR